MYRISFIVLASLVLAVPSLAQNAAKPLSTIEQTLESVAVKIMVKAFQVGDYNTVETLFDHLSLENKTKFLGDVVEMTITDRAKLEDSNVKCVFLDTVFSLAISEAATNATAEMFGAYMAEKACQTQLLGRLTVSLMAQKPKSAAPAVVAMNPPSGAKDVDPNITEITVTFDRPMMRGMAWCTMDGNETFPKQVEKKLPVWSENKQTCTMQNVVLKPGRTYNIWLNSEEEWYSNTPDDGFRSMDNVPLEPVHYTFTTMAAEE
jgi:hypothetical protein